MHVQINTSHDIKGTENFHEYVRSTIEAGLERFAHQLTRVEVHFTDENGDKQNGTDKRCVIEARPAGLPPLTVTQMAGTLDDALESGVEKMTRLLTTHFGKLHTAKGGKRTSELGAGESATADTE
jgi:ribosome-associated translation inhibitor RaiA